MKHKPMIKIITVLSAAAMLTGAVSVSASAAVMDDDQAAAMLDLSETETASDALPSAYSSLDAGVVTPAKHQKYNDCWAYASISVLESKLLKAGMITDMSAADFSELHFNLWATTRSNGKGWIRKKYESGYCSMAPGYLSSWQGGVLESDAADLSPEADITGDMVPTDRAKYGVTAMRYVSRDDTDEVKRAIMENGSIAVGYSHLSQYMNNQTSYYLPPSYSGQKNGHVVAVVGWDDNYDRKNFKNKPEKNGAWLMKSSWGDGNPLNGFYWVSYEDQFFLESKKYKPTFTIEKFEEITDRKKLVQNEIFGATYHFTTETAGELTVLNRLNFDSGFFVLDKVIFETKTAGAEYELYLVPEADGAPDADTANWKYIGGGTTDYEGYICADIDNIEIPDSTMSVAVKLKKSGDDGINLGVDEWLENSNGTMVFIPESEFGMSYIYSDGKMTDLMQWYKDTYDNDLGGTLVIKALTLKPENGDVDLNASVNINDVTLIQQNLAELAELSDNQLKLADFNGDGTIDITDATAIQIKIAS